MEKLKKKSIQQIVDSNIRSFAETLSAKHISELNNPNGIINKKRKNVFIEALEDDEFIFYSAFVRSFDSSFGNVLENIGNAIANLSFATEKEIDSFLLPAQYQKISELKNAYKTDAEHRVEPKIDHYKNFSCIIPGNIESYKRIHKTDHCFFNAKKNEYYIMELKAGGDLDNKKASSEKEELLKEYFMLKNKIEKDTKKGQKLPKINIYFCVAYNKDGENNKWKQAAVQSCFADKEIIVGKKYWNFVCNDKKGFDIVLKQYKESAKYIKKALQDIKSAYSK